MSDAFIPASDYEHVECLVTILDKIGLTRDPDERHDWKWGGEGDLSGSDIDQHVKNLQKLKEKTCLKESRNGLTQQNQ